MSYVTDYEAKEKICEYGRRIYSRGLVDGNGGNITYKVGDNEVWVTPTMESKGYLNPDMLVKLDLDGNLLSKSEYRSSSEVKMHLGVLKANNDIQCVVHTHPTYATALAVVGEDVLSDLIPEGFGYFGEYIPVAPFAMPGTYEMSESVEPFCKGRGHAALLGNHGALTWGRTMKEAYFAIEVLENYCKIYFMTKYIIGHHTEIPAEKLAKMKEMMNSL